MVNYQSFNTYESYDAENEKVVSVCVVGAIKTLHTVNVTFITIYLHVLKNRGILIVPFSQTCPEKQNVLFAPLVLNIHISFYFIGKFS